MKSNGLTYLLLVVVLGVWSVVVWKLFFSKPEVTPAAPAALVTRQKKPANGDTLQLDYPDPFLRAVVPQPAPGAISRTVKKTVPAAGKPEPVVNLACNGRIRSKGTDRYLVSFDGRVHLLGRGESAEGFTLQLLRGDSIGLFRDGKIYFVKIP